MGDKETQNVVDKNQNIENGNNTGFWGLIESYKGDGSNDFETNFG